MNDEERCMVVVQRQPEIVLAENTNGRDFAHLQYCGRPLAEGGICAVHGRRQRRPGGSLLGRIVEAVRV